jgi:hypothetical protein
MIFFGNLSTIYASDVLTNSNFIVVFAAAGLLESLELRLLAAYLLQFLLRNLFVRDGILSRFTGHRKALLKPVSPDNRCDAHLYQLLGALVSECYHPSYPLLLQKLNIWMAC